MRTGAAINLFSAIRLSSLANQSRLLRILNNISPYTEWIDCRMGRVTVRGRADAPDQAAASARARMARGRRAAGLKDRHTADEIVGLEEAAVRESFSVRFSELRLQAFRV